MVPLEDALLVYEVLLTENQIIKAKASLMCKKALEAPLLFINGKKVNDYGNG